MFVLHMPFCLNIPFVKPPYFSLPFSRLVYIVLAMHCIPCTSLSIVYYCSLSYYPSNLRNTTSYSSSHHLLQQ